ncbi:MAG TPA: DUF1292 domain-containing protein [Erysipelotrichaceae bacterium]|nr:DUF1292 domain-containing protein [Erysipelotrichaceae bacterium]
MDTKVTIYDEEGNEVENLEILFEFEAEGENYVLLYDPVKDDGNVMAFKYDKEDKGEGNLNPIETDAEWDMIEEVLGAFEDEQEKNEDK